MFQHKSFNGKPVKSSRHTPCAVRPPLAKTTESSRLRHTGCADDFCIRCKILRLAASRRRKRIQEHRHRQQDVVGIILKVGRFCRKGFCSLLHPATRSTLMRSQRLAVKRTSALVVRLAATSIPSAERRVYTTPVAPPTGIGHHQVSHCSFSNTAYFAEDSKPPS